MTGGTGVSLGNGLGVADGSGEGAGEGGDEGAGVGVPEGEGVGLGEGEAAGVGDGEGAAEGTGVGSGEGRQEPSSRQGGITIPPHAAKPTISTPSAILFITAPLPHRTAHSRTASNTLSQGPATRHATPKRAPPANRGGAVATSLTACEVVGQGVAAVVVFNRAPAVVFVDTVEDGATGAGVPRRRLAVTGVTYHTPPPRANGFVRVPVKARIDELVDADEDAPRIALILVHAHLVTLRKTVIVLRALRYQLTHTLPAPKEGPTK